MIHCTLPLLEHFGVCMLGVYFLSLSFMNTDYTEWKTYFGIRWLCIVYGEWSFSKFNAKPLRLEFVIHMLSILDGNCSFLALLYIQFGLKLSLLLFDLKCRTLQWFWCLFIFFLSANIMQTSDLKLGTLMGVFVPCLQNILGIIYYIRFSW